MDSVIFIRQIIIKIICGLGGICLIACSEKPYKEQKQVIEKLQNNFEDPNTWQSKTGDAAQGKRFTRTDSAGIFSAGITYLIPDSLMNTNLRIAFSGYLRKGERDGAHAFVVSVQNADTTIFWETFEADNYSFSNNIWVQFIDSCQIPGFVNKVKGLEIRIFAWNPRKYSYFDLDDLKAIITKIDYVRRN